jgi:hypothetical protein
VSALAIIHIEMASPWFPDTRITQHTSRYAVMPIPRIAMSLSSCVENKWFLSAVTMTKLLSGRE